MGTLRFDGVWFAIYSHDHLPPYAHGNYAGVRVIVAFDLAERRVYLSTRRGAIQPGKASRADVKHILNVAAQHYEELKWLWEQTHG